MDMAKAPGRTYRYFTGLPLWTFGFGLSYTQFTIVWKAPSDLKKVPIEKIAAVTYTVNVTNVGKVLGDEVVQAYFSYVYFIFYFIFCDFILLILFYEIIRFKSS